MSELISAEARSWIGRSASPRRIEVSRGDIVRYAVATEQTAAKYLAGDEAPPMFLFGALRPVVPIAELAADGLAADEFVPELPLKRTMAGGIKLTYQRPIRPGDILLATRSLTDITEKQGKSGPFILITYLTRVETETGELVAEEEQSRIVR